MPVPSEIAHELGAMLSALPLSDYRAISASWSDAGRLVTLTLTSTVEADVEVDC